MKRLATNGLWITILYPCVCSVIYALQLIPISGIFLMFLLAPFWIGVLIHIMMLHFVVAAGTRHISFVWLLVPSIYYGGGYVLHLYSAQQARALASEIETANSAVKITVEQPFSYLAKGDQALDLFYRYRVPRAFVKASNGEFTQYDHAFGSDCNASLKWSYEKRFEPYQSRPDLFPDYKDADKVWQCVIIRNVKSAQWHYRVDASEYQIQNYLNPRRGTRWRVVDERGGKEVAAVETALIRTLPAIQTVIAGCWLNDSASTWDCTFALWESSVPVAAGYRPGKPWQKIDPRLYDVERFPISALGNALSLEPRLPNHR